MQFNAAMELYNSRKAYKLFGNFVSVANISLQIYLLIQLRHYSIGAARQLLAIVVAYFVTDFVNGLVHMFMDDNDRYDSLWGPLIANFHLHHKVPKYKKCNLFMVYFNESGSKVWLVVYLLGVTLLENFHGIAPSDTVITLVYIGIFSSLAEVSHYLCHSSSSPAAKFLAQIGILLPKRHHAQHHIQDNRNYAFFNGLTDPLLNLIAARFCRGYKLHTDLHFANYTAADLDKRVIESTP